MTKSKPSALSQPPPFGNSLAIKWPFARFSPSQHSAALLRLNGMVFQHWTQRCLTAQACGSQDSCGPLKLSRGRCAQAQTNPKGKKNPVASETNANHVSNLIMDSSSPNNKTIDTKEEKWKLLLREACHDMLAGSVLGLNPAATGLGLSTPRQPTGKARLAFPLRSCLLVCLPPCLFHLQVFLQHSVYAQYLCRSLTPGWEGWE